MIHRLITSRIFRQLSLSLVLFSLVAVQPVLATDSIVCDTEHLQGMIEGFFQLTTGLGLLALVVVWQADTLMEMFLVRSEQKARYQQHKVSALKSGVILLVLGPLYTVAGSAMGLPLATCVDLVPW